MLAHRLRHRITFQENIGPSRDENGYPLPGAGGWQTVKFPNGAELGSVPAEVLTGPGREFQGGATLQAETSARINIRWFPADEREMAAWRIIWDGRTYNIISVETDATARREWRLRVVYGPTEG
ncbi:head-tail adaptor protein [Alcaligenes endophyticus]|uniref:Head-tail adaptor protein n=1 Tax=Alcaligenes endophyticus TaxID=1929088 RepID=A0ABT8ENG5_9BURK|nr:head-tail adaptor protein [Alcaligenes endophyticus]MCX5592801.1 head-tail adaptor protein [Alcaligenes endophyticus]MDN4122843.1 head-tail adaptor protein [Alcaligenes endophyticus]